MCLLCLETRHTLVCQSFCCRRGFLTHLKKQPLNEADLERKPGFPLEGVEFAAFRADVRNSQTFWLRRTTGWQAVLQKKVTGLRPVLTRTHVQRDCKTLRETRAWTPGIDYVFSSD